MRVLLVEDNPGDARLLRELIAEGYSSSPEIEHFTQIGLALQRLPHAHFDVILLDLSLPDMHGYPTFEQMYSHAADIPIIILSGLDDETLARRAAREGAQDYLRKEEVTPGLLSRAIHYAIERKRSEAALKTERAQLAQWVEERTAALRTANAELLRAAQAKDEFLATVNHELRTPLSVVLMLTESLKRGVYGVTSERQHECLERIHKSGNHLLTLINDLLDVAKIESHNLNLTISAVSVLTLCQSALEMVAATAQQRAISLAATFDVAVTHLLADEQRLTQILINLLNNAIKFTPPGGRAGLEVRGDLHQGTVSFTVWDTGIGIAEEDRQKIFQPFMQLDRSLARKYEGSGLGLALVHRLVELHEGRIELESTIGQGSRFTVILPWRKPIAPAALPLVTAVSPTPNPPAPQPLVLLVDDSEISLETLESYLLTFAYRVIVAHDGLEAVQSATEHHPNLILMDIQVPGIDGLEAIRRIRSQPTLQHVPIFALTALAMPGDRARCLAAGATEYISKPVNLEQLTHLMARHLS